MLQCKQYSVSEAGFQVGYSNLSKFSKSFKDQFGIVREHVFQKGYLIGSGFIIILGMHPAHDLRHVVRQAGAVVEQMPNGDDFVVLRGIDNIKERQVVSYRGFNVQQVLFVELEN